MWGRNCFASGRSGIKFVEVVPVVGNSVCNARWLMDIRQDHRVIVNVEMWRKFSIWNRKLWTVCGIQVQRFARKCYSKLALNKSWCRNNPKTGSATPLYGTRQLSAHPQCHVCWVQGTETKTPFKENLCWWSTLSVPISEEKFVPITITGSPYGTGMFKDVCFMF
jgi:hypothetical protein